MQHLSRLGLELDHADGNNKLGEVRNCHAWMVLIEPAKSPGAWVMISRRLNAPRPQGCTCKELLITLTVVNATRVPDDPRARPGSSSYSTTLKFCRGHASPHAFARAPSCAQNAGHRVIPEWVRDAKERAGKRRERIRSGPLTRLSFERWRPRQRRYIMFL